MNMIDRLNKIDDNINISLADGRFYLKVNGKGQAMPKTLTEAIKIIIEEWSYGTDVKQFAIILVEELTGYYFEGHKEGYENEYCFKTDGINLDYDSGVWNILTLNLLGKGTTVNLPNDWLPYLHLAGKVFKESV